MKNKATASRIRIVGGSLKRSPLPVPDLPGLRPTPDRVRETLFNWLNHFWSAQWHDKIVLDLFAGSGALGFEAASRGCKQVVMIESQTSAIRNLRAFQSKHQLTNVTIHQKDAFDHLTKSEPVDLIMLDPPFHKDMLARLRTIVPQVLNNDGLIYIESEQPCSWHEEAPESLELLRSAKAGMVHYQLLRAVIHR